MKKLSLVKRKSNGIYYVVFLDEHGRKVRKSTGENRKERALVFLTDLKRKLEQPERTRRIVFLKDFIQEFLEHSRANFRAGTSYLYELTLKNFLHHTGNLPLLTITQEHVEKFKNLRLSQVKPITVHIDMRNIRAFFRKAWKWELIDRVPFDSGDILPKVEAEEIAYVSIAEFQLLMNIIEEAWLKDVCLFAVLTGARRNEILNLKWDAVNFERREVVIRNSETFKTKTGRSRIIPMNESLYILLNNRWKQHPDREYVFTYTDGKPIGSCFLTHSFKRYCRIAKLSERIHFHSLRHSFATYLVSEGVSLLSVSRLMGHSSTSITEKHYANLVPEALRQAVEKISISTN
jgi:integrase